MPLLLGEMDLRHGLHHSQRVDTSVGLRIDPRVVLASQILQLTQPELEQAIEAELNENPALERLQDDQEPLNDEAILKAVAPHELKHRGEDYEQARCTSGEDDTDWVDLASSGTSLWEHLRAQLLPMLPPNLRPVGEYAVECISEKGYLTSPAEEIALACDCAFADAEAVLAKLKECEPAGVGATDIQECLLLQLRHAETVEERLAKTIIRSHMDEFLARRTAKLMRRYKVMPDVIEAAFAEILSLNPFPGESFQGSGRMPVQARSVGITPDLVLRREESGWEIDVKGADPNSFGIDRAYRHRYREIQADRHVDRDEKRHVNTYVERASNFIKSIHQRRVTLRKIGEYLIQHQTSFVTTGSYQYLQSLTRSQLAQDLGMHESTVSRATQAKYVQIANGEIVPFEVFFKPALRVQKMIEEILQHENPNRPLSDDAISHMLAKKGITVARRTVNKYRDRTKLLSSRKRRSA